MKHDDKLRCLVSCCGRPLSSDDDVSPIGDIDVDLPEAMKLRARGIADSN